MRSSREPEWAEFVQKSPRVSVSFVSDSFSSLFPLLSLSLSLVVYSLAFLFVFPIPFLPAASSSFVAPFSLVAVAKREKKENNSLGPASRVSKIAHARDFGIFAKEESSRAVSRAPIPPTSDFTHARWSLRLIRIAFSFKLLGNGRLVRENLSSTARSSNRKILRLGSPFKTSLASANDEKIVAWHRGQTANSSTTSAILIASLTWLR